MMPMFKNPPRVSIHGSRSKYGPGICAVPIDAFFMPFLPDTTQVCCTHVSNADLDS